MRTQCIWLRSLMFAALVAAPWCLYRPVIAAPDPSSSPLTISAQGSFFVGGESKRIHEPAGSGVPAQVGDITVNQMYVQYQLPARSGRHLPVVMVHGCCLSSKTWETTPDGRMGWSEYFLRHDRPVYVAEQVSRARSGFDPTPFYKVRQGEKPFEQMPSIYSATHQLAWTAFRFGPRFGEAFPDQQFPIESVEELYKQMIPDMNSGLPQNPNPTWVDLAALGTRLKGVVLMGHSESGFFPEHASMIDPMGIKGIISIETECKTDLSPSQIAVLARIPTLIIFGDHLSDVTIALNSGPWSWADAFATCNTFIGQLKKVGGDAAMMHLPALGIKGNSHMLMQDRNNDRIADLIITWIDRQVESRTTLK